VFHLDDKRRTRRLAVFLLASLGVLAALLVGLVRAHGAGGLSLPVISPVGLPTDPTRETAAAFMFTSATSAEFRCALDGGDETHCGAGFLGAESYPGPLAPGRHTFRVWAVTETETSGVASYSWTILASGEAPAGGEGDGSDGQGSGTQAPAGHEPFEISGDVDRLAPGVTETIVLTVRNPNDHPIYVTAISVEIAEDSTPPGCRSAPNIALEQPTGITASSPVLLAPHASVTLDGFPRAPRIGFRNRPWNQDVCKGKSFALDYTGSAHS
jgi:hypothetical protein